MKIIVAGGGRIGTQLARKLVEERHFVTVIDRSREICDAIFQDIGAVTICGEATDPRVLEQAGLATADIAAGLLSRDADTLAFALLVRATSNARVMARVYDKSYLDAFRIAGVRDVIAQADAVVGRITTSIDFPLVQGSMPIGRGEAVLFEIPIPPRGTIVGMQVADLQRNGFPTDCILVCLIRSNGAVDLPTGATVIRGGDLALVVARREQIGAAIGCLAGEPSQESRQDPVADALRRIDLFAAVQPGDLDDVLGLTRHATVPAGASIYAAGEPPDRLFVVLSGEVALVDDDGGVQRRVAAGEPFGVAEMLQGVPRPFGARAEVDTTVAFLRRDSLQQAADASPSLALAMSRALGQGEASLETAPPGWASRLRLPWRRS